MTKAAGARSDNASPSFPLTETGDAEYFAHHFGERVRYDHSRKQWLQFGPHQWRQVPSLMGVAIETMRARQKDALQVSDSGERKIAMKWAIDGESKRRLDSLLGIAQTLGTIGTHATDNWNEDPWLLGVANGVVNLRTGKLRKGRSDERITQSSPVAYDPEAKCPLWLKTLNEIFSGDLEQIDYLQRSLGYSTTGDTREECFFLAHGGGGAGIGTVINTVGYVLGDYTDTLQFKSLERHESGTARNDLAKIVGKRFVTVPESNKSVRLDEGLIKRLTGRDEFTARFLYSEFFTFTPQAKFWLATNHMPSFEDSSEGMARRCRVIAFPRLFKGAQTDRGRKDALRAEASGILRWLVEGVAKWQERGLTPSKAVIKASQRYRHQIDPVTDFLSEQTVEAVDGWIGATAIYTAFEAWCRQREVEPLSLTAFGTEVGKTYAKGRTNTERGYRGLTLRSDGLAVFPISSSRSLYKERKRNNPSPVTAANVDHETIDDDDYIPGPTLEEQRQQIAAHVAAYEEQELRATASDWEMTPKEIEYLLSKDEM